MRFILGWLQKLYSYKLPKIEIGSFNISSVSDSAPVARRSRRNALAFGGAAAALLVPPPRAMAQTVSTHPTDGLPNINIRSFPYNAKGDGVTDDTAAINAAMTAAENLGIFLCVFPAGNYLISSSLHIPIAVSIIGIGPIADVGNNNTDNRVNTTRVTASASFPKLTYMFEFATNWCGRFENFHIDANFAANAGVHQTYNRNGIQKNIMIDNLASNGPAGWYLQTGPFPCANCIFENIIINWFTTGATPGFFTDGISSVLFTRCTFGATGNAIGFVMTNGDNNSFICCTFSSTNGNACQLNQSLTVNACGENYFFDCVFAVAGTGFGIGCVNNYVTGPNTCFGCYFETFPSASGWYQIGPGGRLYLRNCTLDDNIDGLSGAPAINTASPFTYTNTNPFPVQVFAWSGTGLKSLSFSRGGAIGIQNGFVGPVIAVLEPQDSITVGYIGATGSMALQWTQLA